MDLRYCGLPMMPAIRADTSSMLVCVVLPATLSRSERMEVREVASARHVVSEGCGGTLHSSRLP